MKRFFKWAYTIYALIIFAITFMILFPGFFLFAQKETWHRHGYRLYYWWAKIYFPIIFLPIDVIVEEPLDKKKQYIFCPNHFSYLDIATVVLSPVPFSYVGKMSISKVPLFGYMFRKMHIMVDREKLKSKYQTIIASKHAIDIGKSLTIFPEGGIVTKNPPSMVRFKDGAFRVAIEKQIPVVPVTIVHNWIILPSEMPLLLNNKRGKLIFHKPVSTVGLSTDNANELKSQVFETIQNTLNEYHGN